MHNVGDVCVWKWKEPGRLSPYCIGIRRRDDWTVFWTFGDRFTEMRMSDARLRAEADPVPILSDEARELLVRWAKGLPNDSRHELGRRSDAEKALASMGLGPDGKELSEEPAMVQVDPKLLAGLWGVLESYPDGTTRMYDPATGHLVYISWPDGKKAQYDRITRHLIYVRWPDGREEQYDHITGHLVFPTWKAGTEK